MGVRVALVGQLSPDQFQTVRQRANVDLVDSTDFTADGLVAWAIDVDAIVAYLRRASRLRWVHVRWAGVPKPVLEALDGRETVLTNGSGAHGVAVAEYVLGVILQHFKRFETMRVAQLESRWLTKFSFRELRGSRAGIVGLGDLGGSIARALAAFDVELRGLRRSADAYPPVQQVFSPTRIHEFLHELDVLILAAPLTPQTVGLIGANELRRLAPGALLVNVGRAALVDEPALLDALGSGRLGGAALDVFTTEPLPPESPLWRAPNVFISPHCADATPQSLERGFLILVDNLERFGRGEPLRNVVDRDLGY